MQTPGSGGYTAIEIQHPKSKDLPPATAANYFRLSWSGGIEVQMLIGYVDFTPDATQVGKGPMKVTPEVSDRIFMSIRGFALLYMHVQEAASLLKSSGVPLEQLMAEFRGKA